MTSKIPDSNAQLSFLPFCPNEIIPSKFGATKEPCGYDFGFPEILQFFFLVVNTVAIIVAVNLLLVGYTVSVEEG